MPNEINRRPAQRVVPHSQNPRRRYKKRRRGPLMKFRISGVILIWIFSLIGCFGFYMYMRNVHPDKDIWLRKAAAEESTTESSKPAGNALPAASGSSTGTGAAANSNPTAATTAQQPADQTPVTTAPPAEKVNPVPEGEPQPQEYLDWAAFVGEKSVFEFGQQGLLKTYSVYSSETLTLDNYTSEYVMLNGTTIKILSALNSASCPIYLMFGTEDLMTMKADKVIDRFGVLLNQVKAAAPASEIYVLAVPPVAGSQEKNKNALLNTTIDEYNSLLLAVAKQANVYFVDINTALKNNSGKLEETYAQPDGIHLTAEGSQIVLNYVLSHVPAEAKYRKDKPTS